MAEKKINQTESEELSGIATLKSEFIRRQIHRQILSGDFVPGDALPTVKVFSKQYGVAPNTIRQALEGLAEKGLVCRIRGKGTFVGQVESSVKQSGTSNVFCLVVSAMDRDLHPVLSSGFSEGALQSHMQVMLANTANDVYRQAGILLQILDTKMAGVALIPMLEKKTPPHHIEQLQKNGIPVVLCNRPIEGVSAPLVAWDWEEVGRMAARQFLKRGCRRIGYFSNVHNIITDAHIRGIREVLEEMGDEVRPEDIFVGSYADHDEESQECLFKKRLAQPDRPTAILCSDDTEADNVMWIAQETGLRVPQDLAIIGFGMPNRVGKFRKKLTSVTMSGFDVGRKAVELLNEMKSGMRSITNTEVFHIPLNLAPSETA